MTYSEQDEQSAAMQVVIASEEADGNETRRLTDIREWRREGCDLLSIPSGGGSPVPVSVRGELLSIDRPNGQRYHVEISSDEYKRAERDPTWRLELVGNLQSGDIERLTITSSEATARAEPLRYRIPLSGLPVRGEISGPYAPPPQVPWAERVARKTTELLDLMPPRTARRRGRRRKYREVEAFAKGLRVDTLCGVIGQLAAMLLEQVDEPEFREMLSDLAAKGDRVAEVVGEELDAVEGHAKYREIGVFQANPKTAVLLAALAKDHLPNPRGTAEGHADQG